MLKYEELNCVVQNWWWIARNTINWNTWFSFEELVIRQFKYFISFESNSTCLKNVNILRMLNGTKKYVTFSAKHFASKALIAFLYLLSAIKINIIQNFNNKTKIIKKCLFIHRIIFNVAFVSNIQCQKPRNVVGYWKICFKINICNRCL